MLQREESQRWCAAIMRDRAKSFYLATRFLPAEKRRAIEALYGFCRFTDDLADLPGLSLAERHGALDGVRLVLERLDGSVDQYDFPWIPALRDAFARFPIDVGDALQLVRGCRSDLQAASVTTFDMLESYAGDVAGTVGRCTLAVLGATDDDSLRRGERLGIAMQYTNVLRDVREDAGLNRNYLPLAQFDGNRAATMQAVAHAARTYYREASVLAGRVPNDGSRVALLLARSVYEAILDRIERRNYDPAMERAYVPLSGKVGLAVRCLFDAYAGWATIR